MSIANCNFESSESRFFCEGVFLIFIVLHQELSPITLLVSMVVIL